MYSSLNIYTTNNTLTLYLSLLTPDASSLPIVTPKNAAEEGTYSSLNTYFLSRKILDDFHCANQTSDSDFVFLTKVKPQKNRKDANANKDEISDTPDIDIVQGNIIYSNKLPRTPPPSPPEQSAAEDDEDEQLYKVTKLLKYSDEGKQGRLVYLQWNDGSQGWYKPDIPELSGWETALNELYNSKPPDPLNSAPKKKKKK
jgi:hypothetical protein